MTAPAKTECQLILSLYFISQSHRREEFQRPDQNPDYSDRLLEDGCLIYSATAALKNGQRGRNCTCDRPVPGRGCWLLYYALMADPNPDSSGLNPPADNPDESGLIGLRVRKGWPVRRSSTSKGGWEVLVTLQSSLPACLKTPVLQTGSRNTSLELVAGAGITPASNGL